MLLTATCGRRGHGDRAAARLAAAIESAWWRRTAVALNAGTVIIAVEKYHSSDIKNLNHARADAEAVRDLRTQRGDPPDLMGRASLD